MGKQEKIVSMFNDIAGTYDVANRVLSMGIDKSWRNKACNLAFNFYGKKETSPFRKMGHITVLDESLEEALKKAQIAKEILKVKGSVKL